MAERNATAAVVGAGDFIGSAIAKRFAAEGFTHLRRPPQRRQARPARSGDRSERRPLRARGARCPQGGRRHGLPRDADAHAPLEVCIFNPGANVNFPILETTERVFRKVWEMACYAGFLTGREAARADAAARQGHDLLHGRDRQPARRQGLRGVRQRQVRPARASRRAWRASSARRTSTSRTSSSMPAWTRNSCASASGARRRRGGRVHKAGPADESRRRSPRPTGTCTSRRATPGRSSSTCGPIGETGEGWARWNFISTSAAPMPLWRIWSSPSERPNLHRACPFQKYIRRKASATDRPTVNVP